jgi:hypothetical protein
VIHLGTAKIDHTQAFHNFDDFVKRDFLGIHSRENTLSIQGGEKPGQTSSVADAEDGWLGTPSLPTKK